MVAASGPIWLCEPGIKSFYPRIGDFVRRAARIRAAAVLSCTPTETILNRGGGRDTPMDIDNRITDCYSSSMSRSTRFSTAVHILTLLAVKKGEVCSSEMIAKSVGTNPVVVRRIISLLHQAGLVTSQAGSRGGATLAVAPDKVTMRDIYEAVEEQSLFAVHAPHPRCPVACCVKSHVNELIEGAESKMKNELAKTRLSSISKQAAAEFR